MSDQSIQDEVNTGGTQISAEQQRAEKLRSYKNRVNEWQKGKAMFLLSIHMWSGRKVQSDTELQALGIEDMKSYRETRSRGSKLLVPSSSLLPLSRVKQCLEKDLLSLARRRSTFPSVYFFPQERLNDAVSMVMRADQELKSLVSDYLDNPTGYDNDREIMIRKHMSEVGKDALTLLVNRSLESAGDPPEGISPGEWRKTHQERVMGHYGTPEELAEALGLDYDSFLSEYPSKDYIRAAYGVSFEILPLPYETKLSQLLQDYELEKLAEGVAEDTAKARAGLRKMLVDALHSFRKTMREKSGSDKINNRTISRACDVFDQFQAVGGMLGDTESISQLINSCKARFDLADSWTVEEAQALGIEEALEGLLEEANEMVVDIYRDAEFGGEMSICDDETAYEGSTAEDVQLERTLTVS